MKKNYIDLYPPILIILVLLMVGCNKFFNQEKPLYIDFEESKKPSIVFAHITDIHIGEGSLDYGANGYLNNTIANISEKYPEIKLRQAVAELNEYASKHQLDFVMISGDLTDSGEYEEFLKAKEILDLLNVPYLPIIGNHDVWPYTRYEESPLPLGDVFFNDIFSNHFENFSLQYAKNFTDNRKIQTTSKEGHTMFLSNFSQVLYNYRFIYCDFGTRKHAAKGELGVGPGAELFDFDNGTFQWLKQELEFAQNFNQKAIVVSHFPLVYNPVTFHYGFTRSEYRKLTKLLYQYSNEFQYWFCGHWHRNKITPISLIGSTKIIGLNIETKANKEHDVSSYRIVKLP